MIEFDVDMGYLLEEGELDRVILNDENGEHEPMTFWPDRGGCEKLPQTSDTTCVVRRSGFEMQFGYWRCSECGCENFEGAKYCMNCGRKAVER